MEQQTGRPSINLLIWSKGCPWIDETIVRHRPHACGEDETHHPMALGGTCGSYEELVRWGESSGKDDAGDCVCYNYCSCHARTCIWMSIAAP